MNIRQDMHIHTNLSACSGDPLHIPEMILHRCVQNGLDTVCFTDHFWDETMPGASNWYAPQNESHVRSIEKTIPKREDIRVLIGCETEYLGGNRIGISKKTAQTMDFILIPFDHFHMKNYVIEESITDEKAVAQLWMTRFEQVMQLDLPWEKIGFAHMNDILGFSDSLGTILHLLTHEYASAVRKLFSQCAKLGACIEINMSACRSESFHQSFSLHKALFDMAVEADCVFTFGSDAHTLDSLDRILDSDAVAEALGIDNDRVYCP